MFKPKSEQSLSITKSRALDKRGYLVISRDNFCQFCTKTYVVTPHLNCLDTVDQRWCLQIKLVKVLQNWGMVGCAKVLGKLSVLGHPTNLDYSRARAY